MTIKVALIDESAIFRLGLKNCLADSGIEVIGEAADGVSGQRLIRQKQPDMVLLSADLPDGAVLTLCDFAAASYFPQMPMVCLLSLNDFNLLSRLMRTAVKGFLTKSSVYSWREAIETIHSGKTYLQPDMGLEWLHLHEKRTAPAVHALTDREYQILLLWHEERPAKILRRLPT